MNSGGKLWQSGSRTGETVATHCNVQTAPYAARAVHFGLLQSSRNLSRQCYTISATSRTWMQKTVSCLNSMTQRTDPPTGGARRYTDAHRPTQGTARQAAPFAHPTHKHLYEEAHNLSRPRCARQHATGNTPSTSERVVLGTKTTCKRTILNRNRLTRGNLLNDPEGQ